MEFRSRLAELGIDPTEKQLNQCEQYYEFLISKNKVMNLTTITEKEDVYVKHFLDSLMLVKVSTFKNKTILDVGSGAGFPSIPLKIFFPSLKVTIIDALQKRISFLQELLDLLNIDDVTLIHGRAEELKSKEAFDIVTARAIAKLSVLSELCIPFVKKDGLFIAMKSTTYQEELDEARHAIRILGAVDDQFIVYPLTEELSHTLLVFKKIKPSPSIYPRNFGVIKKKPL